MQRLRDRDSGAPVAEAVARVVVGIELLKLIELFQRFFVLPELEEAHGLSVYSTKIRSQ